MKPLFQWQARKGAQMGWRSSVLMPKSLEKEEARPLPAGSPAKIFPL
jgi:hypothetical protein